MFIQQLLHIARKSTLKVSIVGGSNSVMRRGYGKYLNSYISKATAQSTSLNYYSLGGVPSLFGTIQQERHDVAAISNIVFFEYCVNDRHAIEVEQFSLELAGKSLEGFIRKAHRSNPNCLIVILIFGINLDNFYAHHCQLSELYASIGKYYNIPVIDLTKILTEANGLDYVRSLYNEKDHAHYTRPQGVQVVAQTIVDELEKDGGLNSFKAPIKLRKKKKRVLPAAPMYKDNLENLSFIEQFENGKYFQASPKLSVYQNTVFKEKNYTIYQGNSMNFLLKGKLMAIFIKSDLNDGFIEIKCDRQSVVTSSYSSWVNKIKPQNVINLIVSPLQQFAASQDFVKVSIAPCKEYPETFDPGFNKAVPTKQDPQKWKLSIIGIAYIGEIKPCD